MKSRILFVDDNENVLRGLSRMLRKMRRQWDMDFSTSGREALKRLEKTPADVVVSDMRMPDMDGAQLFNEIRRRYPATIRIILSGQSSQETVFRTVGPAHQYLAKPCDPQIMIDSITRAIELREVLDSDALRGLVSGLDTLPTPSSVYFELLEEFQSPKASASSLARIIAQDVGMVAQTLKLTNSAYFGLATKVNSPLQAVRLLGFDTVKAVVMAAGVFSQFQGGRKVTNTLETLSERSISIGALAQVISEMENANGGVPEQTCCAGVLSHVGTLLLITSWPAKFRQAVSMAEEEGVRIDLAERQVFGASHAEIGAYLLGVWGFSDPVVEAVAFHHVPGNCGHRSFSPLTSLHAAQHLTRGERNPHESEREAEPWLDRDYLAELGIEDHLPRWQQAFRKFVEKEKCQ